MIVGWRDVTMSSNYNVVGQLAQRSDGPDKVTGRGVYGLDRTLPDMLWCKFLRSPFAHAKIVNVDTSEAEALEGVHLVLTGKEKQNKFKILIKKQKFNHNWPSSIIYKCKNANIYIDKKIKYNL